MNPKPHPVVRTPRRRVAAGLRALVLGVAMIASLAPCAVSAQSQDGSATNPDGVNVGRKSRVANLVSAEKIERQSAQEYAQMLREAAQNRALAPEDYPQLVRLRRIAQRLIPHVARFNERAPQWKWEVNLIGSRQVNAFCMPGGKIAFYSGILESLKLTDDEVATVMGHEIAHALREHGRERAAKSTIAQGVTLGASVLSQVLGYGDLGRQVASAGSQLALLKFSREDETEADIVGMDLAARAGFDPRAGIALWQKMSAHSQGQGQPPQWLSTHPSHGTRVEEIRRHLRETLPLYARALGQSPDSLPPYRSNDGSLVQ